MTAGDREDPMTAAIFNHPQSYTEEEFLTLPDSANRIELFDGGLLVTPAPTFGHQFVSRRLANALDAGANAVGLLVSEAVNVRLRQGRITIPDVVVSTMVEPGELVVDVSEVKLVCEIVSPSNAANDRVFKMHYYAVAGIPRYLLVDPATGTLHLYELSGETYQETATAEPGHQLRLAEPVEAVLEPEKLILHA